MKLSHEFRKEIKDWEKLSEFLSVSIVDGEYKVERNSYGLESIDCVSGEKLMVLEKFRYSLSLCVKTLQDAIDKLECIDKIVSKIQDEDNTEEIKKLRKELDFWYR